MASADTPQIQHEQESSYTRPTETYQSSSVNDAKEVQTPTAEAGNGKKPDDADDIELTGPGILYTCIYIVNNSNYKEYMYMYMFYCFSCMHVCDCRSKCYENV